MSLLTHTKIINELFTKQSLQSLLRHVCVDLLLFFVSCEELSVVLKQDFPLFSLCCCSTFSLEASVLRWLVLTVTHILPLPPTTYCHQITDQNNLPAHYKKETSSHGLLTDCRTLVLEFGFQRVLLLKVLFC